MISVRGHLVGLTLRASACRIPVGFWNTTGERARGAQELITHWIQ